MTTQAGRSTSRGEQRDDHDRVVPAAEATAGDTEHESGEADHEGGGAEHVVAPDGVRFCELAQDQPAPAGAEEGERDVEPEDPVPGDGDERAAEHGTEHEPDRGDHGVGAHGQAELLARKGVCDERGCVGEEEGRADALQDAPEDEDGRVGGKAGTEGGEREEQEAADVGALAPEQVAEASGAEDEHGCGDEVGEDDPYEREQARVQRALEVGQGDDQRAGVGGREQHAETGA